MDVELTGGNASGAVVKVGDTVRKAWTPATPSVQAFMMAVRDKGVDVPVPKGRDDQGCQIVEFVPGRMVIDAEPLTPSELSRVGAMVRAIHDAGAAFVPSSDAQWETAILAPGAELICHNDLAPWNLVIGDRWVFIDWDAAAPSTRLWDLAYAAQAFTLSDVYVPPERAADRLRAFVDGYDADPSLRADLPSAMARRTQAMLDMLKTAHADGSEPWATMFADGHGTYWASVVDYVTTNIDVWREALVPATV